MSRWLHVDDDATAATFFPVPFRGFQRLSLKLRQCRARGVTSSMSADRSSRRELDSGRCPHRVLSSGHYFAKSAVCLRFNYYGQSQMPASCHENDRSLAIHLALLTPICPSVWTPSSLLLANVLPPAQRHFPCQWLSPIQFNLIQFVLFCFVSNCLKPIQLLFCSPNKTTIKLALLQTIPASARACNN